MKSLFLILLPLLLCANTEQTLLSDYQAKKFHQTCLEGSKLVYQYRHNDTLLNMIANSCINSDNIDMLGRLIPYLKHTKASRNNASLYATLLLEKKLLLQHLIDGIDISSLTLPAIHHELSRCFDALSRKTYIKTDDIYRIKSDNNEYYTLNY